MLKREETQVKFCFYCRIGNSVNAPEHFRRMGVLVRQVDLFAAFDWDRISHADLEYGGTPQLTTGKKKIRGAIKKAPRP